MVKLKSMIKVIVLMNGLLFLFQANHYYKLFITWTNQKIRKTFVQRNMFDFKHINVCTDTAYIFIVFRTFFYGSKNLTPFMPVVPKIDLIFLILSL